jgi:plasmid stabilization system protein ParE
MIRRLIVKPEAETDVADGYRWYQARQSKLGERYLEELDAAFQRIVENPAAYQEVLPEVRRAVAHTFPYLVFFTFDPEAVYILAVIPAAQDPQYISARLTAGT